MTEVNKMMIGEPIEMNCEPIEMNCDHEKGDSVIIQRIGYHTHIDVYNDMKTCGVGLNKKDAIELARFILHSYI